jgi:hypothetical protein
MRKTLAAACALVFALLALLPGAATAKRSQHATKHQRQAAKHRRDANRDGIPDRWERRYKLSLRSKQARRDPDRDGMANLAEYRSHTNPRRADTDRDGLRDGIEPPTANDPTDPDTDGDGIKDGNEHAGRIVSFAGGVLTVRLARGGTVRGSVTAETSIACGNGAASLRQLPDSSDAADPAEDADEADEEDAEDPEDPGDEAANEESGDPAGEETDSDTAGDPCAASLTRGRYVHQAWLEAAGGGLVFLQIELVR